jgi:glycosyltransferase involved in cell wall biosynthesis
MTDNDRTSDKVSIIIPTYNRAAYINESVMSALYQTHKDIEVIVVDDGSTDNTREIISLINDQRIKYIHIEHKGLQSAVRNKGIQCSTGNYISFLDSDDLLAPEAIATLLRELKSDDGSGLAYAKVSPFGDVENKNIRDTLRSIKHRSGYVFEHQLMGSFITCLAVMFKTECLEKSGMFYEDPDIVIGEDWYFFLKISYYYKVKYVDEILGYYRMHHGNVNQNSRRAAEDSLKIIIKVIAEFDMPESLKDKALANTYFNLAKVKMNIADPTYRQDLLSAFDLKRNEPIYLFSLLMLMLPQKMAKNVFRLLKKVKNLLRNRGKAGF